MHNLDARAVQTVSEQESIITVLTTRNSSGDEIANVNFFTTTLYMYKPAHTPIELTS